MRLGVQRARCHSNAALRQYEVDRTGDSSRGQLMEAVKHAISYALLIIFNAYLAREEGQDKEDDYTRETTAEAGGQCGERRVQDAASTSPKCTGG